MSPQRVSQEVIRTVPLLRSDQDIGSAAREIAAAGVSALPVIDASGRYEGIFGEREFIGAIFPAYLGELRYAAFVPDTLDEGFDHCSHPVSKYVNTEHIDAGLTCSDAQLAETFLHHRVLIIPIIDEGAVRGIVTRWDFFKAVAKRLPQ